MPLVLSLVAASVSAFCPVSAQTIQFSGVPPNATVQCLSDVPNGLMTVVGACPIAILSSHVSGDVIDLRHAFLESAVALQLGGGGALQYRQNIEDGYPGILSLGDGVNTLPGNNLGPTIQGFSDRLAINPIVIMPSINSLPPPSSAPVFINGFFVVQALGSGGWNGQVKVLGAGTSPANVTASSSCSATASVAFSETQASPTITCSNVFTRTWTATDACNSTAIVTQTIVIADTPPPLITCPIAVTVNTGIGQCSASNVNLSTPVVTDNCFGLVAMGNNAPSVFPKGTNSVIWTATDSCGNSATCTQKVIVVDNQPPVISLPANILTNATDPAVIMINFAAAATDNCDGGLSVSCTPLSGSTFALGTTPVTCMTMDAAGNVATQSFRVTAFDDASFRILSVSPASDGILLTWIMPQGCTGNVQVADQLSDSFSNLNPTVFEPGSGFVTTNFVVPGAMTNSTAQFYRIRLLP